MSNFDLFEHVESLTKGDRRKDYDHPLINHLRISIVWSVQTGIKMNPILCAWMLGAGLKLSRQVKTSKFDNVVDNTGYMDCVVEMCNLYNELYYPLLKEVDENLMTRTMQVIESLTIGEQWDLLELCLRHENKKLKQNE